MRFDKKSISLFIYLFLLVLAGWLAGCVCMYVQQGMQKITLMGSKEEPFVLFILQG